MGVGVACALFWVGALLRFHSQLAVAEAQTLTPVERQLIGGDDGHPGFISIDCGSTTASYYHQATGLIYKSDDGYISTGNNMNVSSVFTTTDPQQDLYSTVRRFPDWRRSCYTLSPLVPNNKYLIRARFMYGNYDGRDTLPRFDVYIGVNYWFTVKPTTPYKKLAPEIIHYSVSESIDVCLVGNGHGSPFISALELRPLDDSIYNASSDFSLNRWIRWDFGRSVNSSEENDDAYNRLWDQRFWQNTTTIQTNKSFAASSANPYKVPNGVLSTACELNGSSLGNEYNTSYPTSKVYAYWHFAELESLGSNDTREFYINVPLGHGYKFGPVRPDYLQPTTIQSGLIPLNGSDFFVFSLNKTDESNRYPILNAVETYKVLDLPYSPTNAADVDAITAIKNQNGLVLMAWQGDPCLPKNYQWDGLICAYDGNNPPSITSLNLSSRNLTGEIPQPLSELKSLQDLNLSNNGFTGKIPDFLAQLPSLRGVDLSGNNLTGPVPPLLVQKFCNNSISLRLEGNSIVCKTTINKKGHRFIIPLLASIASVSILVIIGIIVFAYKRREKKGIIYRTIKSRNKRFRYSDIVKITDNFKKSVGKGAFGTVYHGLLQDGTQVAVKILNNTSSALSVKQFCAEAELLTKIHHVNLVSLIGYCDERSNMALVYEYLSCGDLKMHLSANNEHSLSWKTRLQISIDAAQGLEYLHSGCQPTIIHRDVKPANILLDEAGHAKIADFGLSRFFTTASEAVATTDIAGTHGYLDPEYCQMNTISDKSDVFGFGVVLLELITGKPAIFKNANRSDQRIHIVKWATEMVEKGDILAIVDKRLQGDFNANVAWKFLEIAMACVNLIGNQRPRMSEVVAVLKLCYSSEEYHDQNATPSAHDENGHIHMSQAFDTSPMAFLPEAR